MGAPIESLVKIPGSQELFDLLPFSIKDLGFIPN